MAEVLDDTAEKMGPPAAELRRAVDTAVDQGFTVDMVTGDVSGPLASGGGEGGGLGGAESGGNSGMSSGTGTMGTRRDRCELRIKRALVQLIDEDRAGEEALGHQHPPSSVHRSGVPLGVDAATAGIEDEQSAEVERIMGAGDDDFRVLETAPGTTAVAYGDIDAADRMVTLVPGTGSSAADIAEQVEKLEALHGDDTVVVVWTYDAPPGLTSAASADLAVTAGRELAAFQSRATEHGFPRMDVVGHSYGAMVVAQATRGTGLRADSVALIAAPGAGPGIDSVRDMTLVRHDGTRHPRRDTGRRVIVNTSVDDIIQWVSTAGIHGADPRSRNFGANVKSTVALAMSNHRNEAPLSIAAHSEDYFTDERWARLFDDWSREAPGSGPER